MARWRTVWIGAAILAALTLICRGPHSPSGLPWPQTRRPADVTFLVASDTHLGLDAPEDPSRDPLSSPAPIESRNLAMIDRMNHLAGTPFPEAIGGNAGTPSAVLIAGDLTETGGKEQWREFMTFYGKNGRLHFPVFETCGNHDREKDTFVLDRIRERHGDTFYTFDLGGVHFVSLGEAPDDQGLAFLEKDLHRCPANTPIVLFFHLPLQGPWAEQNWFGQGDYRARLKALLAGHPIQGIFHGHSHFSSVYRWNGIDVYNPGSVKHSQRGFLVVQIQNDRMTVAEWNLDSRSWWWWHQKPLDPSKSDAREIFEVRALRDSRIQPYVQLQPR